VLARAGEERKSMVRTTAIETSVHLEAAATTSTVPFVLEGILSVRS
jgi:hypothetical protein